MSISNAVGSERVSAIIGYNFTQGNFSDSTPNLPQRIAVIGEGNTANQGSMPTTETEITTLKQAGDKFGYGSPIYHTVRILKSTSGANVGGIPVVVYPQLAAGGAVARVQTITVTGTATASGTNTAIIAGRGIVEGDSYSYTVNTGDTASEIASKMADAINGVLGSPVTAVAASAVVTLTSKWAGLTSNDIKASVNTGASELGVSYAVAEVTAGAGTPSVTTSLNEFGNKWNTIVVNTYGVSATSVADELEAFNGIPDPEVPTGRFRGIVMKPFIALTGSTNQEDTAFTDARKTELTIAVCPAPLSEGLPMEAAANMCVLFARISQDNPHLDVESRSYSDMPTTDSSINMDIYENRDAYVKKGNSTVMLVDGKYRVSDFVTTYHPTGESIPQYRYARSLVIDMNIRFGYHILEEQNVIGNAIAADDDITDVSGVIKPKTWKGVINSYADDLAKKALIAEADFMKNSIVTGLSSTNPDRLETFFKYKRSGYFRIGSTTAEAGFNLG